MAKTSIYLPDDLAEQVRVHGISISEVAQAALRQAVKDAQIKENVMADIQAVAERLQETRRRDTEKAKAEDDRVRAMGGEWARTRATAKDLEYIAGYQGSADDYHLPASLFDLFMFAPPNKWSGLPTRPGEDRWDCFQAGAREVWDAVQPHLADTTEDTPGSPRKAIP